MEAYARKAHLGKVKVETIEYEPFMGDALTVNGYLGRDGINPLIKVKRKTTRHFRTGKDIESVKRRV